MGGGKEREYSMPYCSTCPHTATFVMNPMVMQENEHIQTQSSSAVSIADASWHAAACFHAYSENAPRTTKTVTIAP